MIALFGWSFLAGCLLGIVDGFSSPYWGWLR